jgi:predicted O-methyltransferase YrrM
LKREFPALKHLEEFAQQAMIELEPSYREYVTEVSRWNYAISLEMAGVLMACCRLLQPKSVLDTGSGYSSFVLRMYAAQTSVPVSVVSVDDNEAWLETTKAFLKRNDLPLTGAMTWSDAFAHRLSSFDLVLHDLGLAEEDRARTLGVALQAVRPGGIVLLDDMHMERYGPYARQVLRARRFAFYSLRSITREQTYARYAVLGVSS